MKRDKYRRARGGTAFMLNIFCTACGAKVMEYQKDGPGDLKRCYLNRIFWPCELERLQHDPFIHQPKQLSSWVCQKCGVVIGTPTRHHDGRLAFRLKPGHFSKKRKTLGQEQEEDQDEQNQRESDCQQT